MVLSIFGALAEAILQGMSMLAGYVTNSSTFPQPLSEEDEAKHLARLQTGDEEARAVLIERNLRLVAHIVKKFDNTGEEVDDLISIGTVGLIKAIGTFRPDKGTRLATYAARCIENEMAVPYPMRERLGAATTVNTAKARCLRTGLFCYAVLPTIAAAAAAETAAATAAAGTLLTGPGLVDGQRTAAPVGAVEGLDHRCSLISLDLHKTEATAPAGLPVSGDAGGNDLSVLGDSVGKVLVRRSPGQVTEVQSRRHVLELLSAMFSQPEMATQSYARRWCPCKGF